MAGGRGPRASVFRLGHQRRRQAGGTRRHGLRRDSGLAAAAIKAAEVEAMSRSIAAGGVVYLVCAGILFAAYLLARRPSPASSD